MDCDWDDSFFKRFPVLHSTVAHKSKTQFGISCFINLLVHNYLIQSIECVFESKNSLGSKRQFSPKQTWWLACICFCSCVQIWQDHLSVPSVSPLMSCPAFSPSVSYVYVSLFSWVCFCVSVLASLASSTSPPALPVNYRTIVKVVKYNTRGGSMPTDSRQPCHCCKSFMDWQHFM